MRARSLIAGVVICLVPASLLAQGGVIELNHAKALAGDSSLIPPDDPGYPIEIRAPGSYRLTSDMQVPQGANGVVVAADLVNLDLNGFAIRGTELCFPGGCQPATTTSGIIHDSGGGGGFVTVRNGDVSNFGGSCIRLRDGGRVENVRILACGEHGIHLRAVFFPSFPGTAFGNYITNTGNSSLVLEAGGVFRDNVMQNAGLNGAGPTIVGGTATGGNLCDDGRCSKRGWRRYYLSLNTANGSQALTACEAGFHMASRWELMDLANLEYDTVRGMALADSGTGPPVSSIATPSQAYGWAHMGTNSLSANSLGSSNCAAWTDDGSGGAGGGTVLLLDALWANSTGGNPPWNLGSHACGNANRVWCIED